MTTGISGGNNDTSHPGEPLSRGDPILSLAHDRYRNYVSAIGSRQCATPFDPSPSPSPALDIRPGEARPV
jgi:hypothetical protein